MIICSICNEPIPTTSYGWSEGNNAQPINDGRCCDNCDATVVIPKRIERVIMNNPRYSEQKKQDILGSLQIASNRINNNMSKL